MREKNFRNSGESDLVIFIYAAQNKLKILMTLSRKSSFVLINVIFKKFFPLKTKIMFFIINLNSTSLVVIYNYHFILKESLKSLWFYPVFFKIFFLRFNNLFFLVFFSFFFGRFCMEKKIIKISDFIKEFYYYFKVNIFNDSNKKNYLLLNI